MTPSRDSIFAALLVLLKGVGIFTPTSYVSRRFVLWDQLSPEQFPALILWEPGETISWPGEPLQKGVLRGEAIIYVQGSPDLTVNNVTALDNLLDAIDAVLKPAGADAQKGRQTLGGLVQHCRIEGEIVKASGDTDNISLLIVPIRILTAQKIV
jgi:hypothetical protein